MIAVLLDDDELVRMSWSLAAKEAGIELKCFGDSVSFLHELHGWDRRTEIYFDSNLKNGDKGEEVAKFAYSLGFKNLYLVTGYPKERFKDCPWILEVRSKEAPWPKV